MKFGKFGEGCGSDAGVPETGVVDKFGTECWLRDIERTHALALYRRDKGTFVLLEIIGAALYAMGYVGSL